MTKINTLKTKRLTDTPELGDIFLETNFLLISDEVPVKSKFKSCFNLAILQFKSLVFFRKTKFNHVVLIRKLASKFNQVLIVEVTLQ